MPDVANPTDFERSDVPPRLLAALAIGFALTVAAVLVALSLAFPEAIGDIDKGPLSALPPQPRLQIAPREARRAYEQDAARRLHGYGWADQGRQRVREPIERAMREVAGQGWRNDAQ
jgi:hypothetical protein